MRLIAASLAALACLAAPPAPAHDKLGANLNFIGDFHRNHEFSDLVKQSRRFLKLTAFDDGPLANRAAIGADGWPTEDFRLFPMTAQQGVLGVGGTYKLVFTGQATVTPNTAAIQNQAYDAGTNTTRADVVFTGGNEGFYLDFTGTGGTVKDIRLLRPGVPETGASPFTAAWLAHTNRFSVLRFLDWTRTNGNRHVAWADRTTPDKQRTEAYIAQWETVVAAANALGRDAWINVPVQANDEYVTNLATLFRDQLASGLNLYVEYGNELWNFSIRDEAMDNHNGGTPFNAATVNRDLAAASPPASPLRFEPADDTTLAYRRVALRLKEIADIFTAVWGAPALNTRVRPVLAGQMGNSFVVSEGLRVIDEGLGIRPDTVFYAIAGAPYIFGAAEPDGDADEAPNLTVDDILDGMAAGVANAPSETNAYQYLSHAGLGAWYGLKVMAYEAGFDNFGANNIASKRGANLDPSIKAICRDYIDQWHSFGFDTVLWFNAGAASYDTQFGMWPLIESYDNPTTPKNQCMDEVLAAALPAVTVGTPVLGAAIAGGSYRGGANPSGPLSGVEGPFGFPGYVEYLLRADAAGSYDVVFTGSAPGGETFRVELNNALVAANVALPASPGASSAVPVALRQGLNALRIKRSVGGSWSLATFTFTLVSAAPTLGRSATAIDFGGQSMATTSPPRVLTLSNTGGGTLDITAIGTSNAQFAATHDCASLAPAASCTVTVTFSPAATAAALNAGVPVAGSLTIASNASGAPHAVALAGTAERSLVTHYYRSILRRAPDAPGAAFWASEANRLAAIGANVNETWFAMSAFFYFSPEYVAFNRTPTEFVSDLYNTFFNRPPDAPGLAFWTGQMSQGMPREVVLVSFMFSTEFVTFAQGIFGNTAARAEVDTVFDFYRGLLSRLPDQGGYDFWVQQFRTAQCQGAGAPGAVYTQVESISSGFANGGEYLGRNRTNAQYVGDLYNSFLRRGGDNGGVQFWIGQLDGAAMTRDFVRQQFIASGEFTGRVDNIINQGCLP